MIVRNKHWKNIYSMSSAKYTVANILCAYDAGQQNGTKCLGMEYIVRVWGRLRIEIKSFDLSA